MPRRLIPLLLALACGYAPGAEPIVATPYEVRHEIQELLDDLASKRGDRAALLDRAQTALAKHGDYLLTQSGTAVPIAELVTAALRSAGLGEDFVSTFTPVAERRLAALSGPVVPAAELRRIALGYPGTPAAHHAWRRLADMAWDAGSLSSFLAFARQAQDDQDAARRPRLAAATALALPPPSPQPPETVAGIEELWRLDLGEPQVVPRGRQRSTGRLELTTGPAEMSALSDGFRLRLFDHVVGRLHGDEVVLGNQPLGPTPPRPVALRDGFAAVGMLDDQIHVVALDSLGRLRWQQILPQPDRVMVSAPVRFDDLLVFALVAVSREGADLLVMALHTDTGRTAWSTQVARLPGSRPMIMATNEATTTPPVLAVAGGTLVLCANNGLMARIGADGAVQRVWSYASIYDELDRIIASHASQRGGDMASDGRFTATTPADSNNTVMILGPDDPAPRRYTGDNAGGDVADARDGAALIIGERAVTLVDLATAKARWTAPLTSSGTVRGILSHGRVLLAGGGQVVMLDAADGQLLAERRLPDQPLSFSVIDDALLVAQNWNVIGLGRGASFLERLTAATKRDPDDYRPLVALASLFEARDDRDQALACLLQALARNAPQEYSERAARLVRRDLELAAGDAKAFPPALARLESIVRFDRRQEAELAWWRARHAELIREKATAIQLYRAVLAGPDRTVTFANRLEMSLHSLAETGLARLSAVAAPSWFAETPAPPALRGPSTSWPNPGSPAQQLLLVDSLALGMTDGLLTARRLADGSDVWWRMPSLALLGVMLRRTPPDELAPQAPNIAVLPRGLVLDIMPGSAAAAAGMRSGDCLLSFNGKPTTNFERDLRGVVLTMAPRAPFTVEVERNRERIICRGRLGGDQVQPIAAAAGLALVWPLTYKPELNPPLVPEGMWFAALDLADGKELWRWSLPPMTTERMPITPLMTAGGLVITQDGGDVVALTARSHGADGPAVRWRLNGAAMGLASARLLTPQLLWLPLGGRNQVALVDVDSGRIHAQLPVSAEAQVLAAGGEFAVRDSDGRPTLWDLTQAHRRWRSEGGASLLAFCGDGLLVLDESRRLALLDRIDGAQRRLIGDWTMIEDWRCTHDSVLVHARREGRQVLAAISLPGATLRWELPLSPRAEIKNLVASSGYLGAILNDGPERDSLLLLDLMGTPHATMRLAPGEHLITAMTGGALLLQGPAGLRATLPVLPPTAPLLPLVVAEPGSDLITTAAAVLPRLVWQQIGPARYAVARTNQGVLVFSDLPPGSPPLEILLNDSAPLIEVAGSPLRFTPNGPVFSVVPGSWLMGGTIRLEAPPGILRRDCVRLEPPPGRLPGMPLAVRAACGNASDAADAPWWLHRGWREVR